MTSGLLVVEGTKLVKNNKKGIIFVKADERLKAQIRATCEIIDTDMSKFTRSAVVEKLTRLSLENREVAKALKAIA